MLYIWLIHKLSKSLKFVVLLKFLKRIINKYPTENSTLANPKIKKLVVNVVKLSFKIPTEIYKQYNITQVNSE